VRCLVLASPAFKVKLYVPFARPGLALMKAARQLLRQQLRQAAFLTHDPSASCPT
jgi:hypothetical protein